MPKAPLRRSVGASHLRPRIGSLRRRIWGRTWPASALPPADWQRILYMSWIAFLFLVYLFVFLIVTKLQNTVHQHSAARFNWTCTYTATYQLKDSYVRLCFAGIGSMSSESSRENSYSENFNHLDVLPKHGFPFPTRQCLCINVCSRTQNKTNL